MNKYKIMYACQTSYIGGAEQSLLSLVSALDRDYFYPIIIVTDDKGPLFKRLKELNIETIVMPLNRLRWKNPFPFIITVFKLVILIRQRKISLIHSNIGSTNQYLAVAAIIARIPMVSHLRAIITKQMYWEYLFFLPNNFIANSNASRSSIFPYLRKGQKCVVIHNAINLDWFVPGIKGREIREQYGISDDAPLVGVAGRLIPEKGQSLFIDAFKEISQENPHLFALIVGGTELDGSQSYLDCLKQKVKEYSLENRIIFTGFIEDIASIYACIDLLVVPSQYEESFGRVLIEAMAMEKPVIATNVGGIPEIVVDGKTGLLVPLGDINALAESMIKLADNAKLRECFGKEGRKRVEQMFDIKNNVQKTQHLYMEILGSKSNVAQGKK